MIQVILLPISTIESAGGGGIGWAIVATTTDMTWSSTALMSPALFVKWCCTRPTDTPAASATVRNDVADVPYVAKVSNAALRIRSILERSSAVARSSSGSTDIIHTHLRYALALGAVDNMAVSLLQYKHIVTSRDTEGG